MISKADNIGLMWDFAIPESLTGTQRWVLSAMQNRGQELVTMLWRILGNEQDVCDAYQDTFLKLAHYHGGQKPQHIKAYLFRTASNVAISMIRRKIIERKNLPQVADNKKTKTPDSELNSADLQERLRFNIARLPEHLRNVVTLHDLGELSYLQVGKTLGISQATVRVYRCRAVQLLAVWMKKNEW
ncbi:MAG: RNA polymerase sigma factor [Planctomycetes bacterium]|nr:RNA polymerase sigma factor [Planctomycetota bacterium]MBL7107388.1 RNA polymerase sigma factor [Phycisphaerae bacterium]